MSIISGYEEQLELCCNFTCSLSTHPWCACCLHAQIQYHHCINKGKPERGERQEVCQESPTAKGCQHPTAKGSQHYPRIHLSVLSIHSRYRNLQKGLHSGNCLPHTPTPPTSIFIYSILPYKGLHSGSCLPQTPTLPTSIFIYSILPSCLTKIRSFVLSWMLSRSQIH